MYKKNELISDALVSKQETNLNKLSNFNSYSTMKISSNDYEFHNILKLRADIYIDEFGFLNENMKQESGEEIGDEYDFLDSTAHFAVYGNRDNSSEILGTIRIIQKDSEATLPIEKFFKDEIGQVPEGASEVSRFMVRKNYRAKESDLFVSLLLIRAGIDHLLKTQSSMSYAVLEKELVSHLKDRIGIPYRILSEETYLEEYNSYNYATAVEPNQILEAVYRHDRELIQRRSDNTLETKEMAFGPFFQNGAEGKWEKDCDINDLLAPNSIQKSIDRNTGFISKEDQSKLSASTVAIAGVGGDGGRLAIELARLGVKKFRLADPECFEYENLNRQEGSEYESINKNKAIIIAQSILKINPHADVTVYPYGVNETNISQFIYNSDLVIDETEMTIPNIGVMIAQEARNQNISVLMALNVGYGCQVTSFKPDGYPLEKKLGLQKDVDISEIKGTQIGLDKWLAYIPSYVERKIFKDVESGKISAPSLIPGVDSAASIGATEAIKHLTNKKPIYAPKVIIHDSYEHKTKVSNFPTMSFGVSALKMILRDKIKNKH